MVQEAVGDRQVWRPRIRFRTKPLRQCPFLANDVDEAGVYRGLCTLHTHDKPLVCALSPLTRSVESDGPQVLSETWAFVPPVDGCPGVGIGDVVDLGPPSDLRPRLDDEVLWMHRVLNETGNLADEDAAWAWLDNQGSLGVP